MLTGTVKWFDDAKGYGFIVSRDLEGDILVHHKDIRDMQGRRFLTEGQTVYFLHNVTAGRLKAYGVWIHRPQDISTAPNVHLVSGVEYGQEEIPRAHFRPRPAKVTTARIEHFPVGTEESNGKK